MIEQKVSLVIHKLAKLTKENKMVWEKTNRVSEYVYSFSHGKVTIDRWFENEEDSTYVEFVIYNNNGEQTERIVLSDFTNPDYTFLSNFYDIVYKKFIRSEETLDGILSDLEMIDLIDPDEEIPF